MQNGCEPITSAHFFVGLLTHRRTMSLQARRKVASLGLILAARPIGPTGCWRMPLGQFDCSSICGLTVIAAKDVVRNNFPYLHRRIWAHSVVARRLFSQLNGASCA